MKKLFVVLIMSLLLFAGCEKKEFTAPVYEKKESIAPVKGADFRNTNFGMSAAEIKRLETADFLDERNYTTIMNRTVLFYKDTVASFSTYIVYTLEYDKLINCAYMFNQEDVGESEYYNNYCRLTTLYTDTYGEPFKIEEEWINNLYKDSPDNLGLAISLGHVKFISRWETNTSEIVLAIMSTDSGVTLGAMYDVKEDIIK